MEGTNDINADISRETTVFNLATLAKRAEAAGFEVVHATIIPRLPSANKDKTNLDASQLSGAIRELAYSEGRNLADPFWAFFDGLDDWMTLYRGGDDKFHLTPQGYDRLALVFANAITGNDLVPPVTGVLVALRRRAGRQVEPADRVRPLRLRQRDRHRLHRAVDRRRAGAGDDQRQQPAPAHPLPAAEPVARRRLRRSSKRATRRRPRTRAIPT